GKPTIRQQPPLLRDCLFILVRTRDKRKAKLIYRIECEARFWDRIALCPSNKIDRHTRAKKCRSVTMCVCVSRLTVRTCRPFSPEAISLIKRDRATERHYCSLVTTGSGCGVAAPQL
uniref:Uncharacterized protein n=1 Tax=Anopheles coluzzii TaxID=1518534 RepID=A0A6E8VVY1_ANOCL